VRINGTDLIQILLNLTINGFQCAQEGHSVDISGRYEPRPLDLSRLADGPEDRLVNREGFKNTAPLLALSVTDTGPGIPADVLPKIFDPYFTTKSASQGTGLGLNVVQRLIKEAKAVLHVHTQIGQGTTFTVYLPAI
jgi:signal transduction histidine kinase